MTIPVGAIRWPFPVAGLVTTETFGCRVQGWRPACSAVWVAAMRRAVSAPASLPMCTVLPLMGTMIDADDGMYPVYPAGGDWG